MVIKQIHLKNFRLFDDITVDFDERLNQDKMKIEHFQSQHEFPELQLNFNNLLASCKGNEKSGFE